VLPAIADVRGVRVRFEVATCRHLCYTAEDAVSYCRRPPKCWSQDRAERLPWILPALRDPRTEIRVPPDLPRRQLYFLRFEAEPLTGALAEYYLVTTEHEGPSRALFLTAFPAERSYWERQRRRSPRRPG
jgi:hypothetical protein